MDDAVTSSQVQENDSLLKSQSSSDRRTYSEIDTGLLLEPFTALSHDE